MPTISSAETRKGAFKVGCHHVSTRKTLATAGVIYGVLTVYQGPCQTRYIISYHFKRWFLESLWPCFKTMRVFIFPLVKPPHSPECSSFNESLLQRLSEGFRAWCVRVWLVVDLWSCHVDSGKYYGLWTSLSSVKWRAQSPCEERFTELPKMTCVHECCMVKCTPPDYHPIPDKT